MVAGPVLFKASAGTPAFSNASSTTIGLTTTTQINVGDFVVVRWASDNLSATTPTATCADGGNTYTVQRQGAVGSAGTGVAGGILTSLATAVRGVGSTITVTFSGAVVAKAMYAEIFTGVLDAVRSTAVSATGTAAAASAPASGTVSAGDLVLGSFAQETRAALTPDSDTLNGNWSIPVTRTGGATSGQDASSVTVSGQYKIATAAGAQTFNYGAVSGAEWWMSCVVMQAAPPAAITQASYRFFAEGAEATSVALAAQDTVPPAVNVGSGDVNLQLRVRMQAGADAVPPETDLELQYSKNGGAWGDVLSNPAILTTYPFSQWQNWSGVVQATGQSFTGNGEKLARMAFDINKAGTPPGTYTAALYAHSGTLGTSSVGTGAPLATSTTALTASGISATFGWVFFEFDGTYTLANGTNYVMAITTNNIGDGSNRVSIVWDSVAPTRPGNACTYNGTTWSANNALDYMTRVYTVPTTLPTNVAGANSTANYDLLATELIEGTATTQRLTGGTGSFNGAGTVAVCGLCEGIGWPTNSFVELVYGITLKSANLANGDTLTFRVIRNNDITSMTYTVTPTLTATVGPPPTLLVVDNATHATTSTGPGLTYLDPQVALAKTADPGPLPNEWTWRFKVSGPTNITTYGTSTTIASQGNDSASNQGWYLSRSSEATDESITTEGDIYTNYAFVSNGNATPGWSMGVATGGPPKGSPEVFAVGASQIALGYWGYRSTDDGASWTYMSGYTWGGSEPAYDSPEQVIIGSANGWTPTGNAFAGRIYWLEMRTGSDPAAGTLLWRFDPNEWVSGTSWVDARGRTWTLTDPGGIVVSGSPLVLTETVVPTLVVQSAVHAHASDNTVLTQIVVTTLAVQGGVHASTVDTVALGVDLVALGAVHASTAGNSALGVDLAVQGATHTPVCDNAVLTQITSTTLVVANATHAVISGISGGAASPYLFTEDWNTADDTHWDWAKWPIQRPYYTISGNKGVVTPSGGPSVASSDKYVTDFEMTVKVEWQTANPNYPEICWRLYDGLGGYAASSGFVAQVAPGGRVDIYKVGAYSSIGNLTDASLNAAGVRWWKVRAVGNNHKVKWWNDGSAEPGTWQIDATDASPPTDTQGAPIVGGAIGFRSYGAPATIVDDLTVVDLASPPLPVTDGSMRMLSNGKAVALNGNSNAFPSDTDLTWCGWVKYSAYSGNSWDVWSLFSGGSTYCSTSITPAGDLRQYMDTGDFSPGYNVPLNTWVFVAMSRSITGGTDLYWAPAGTSTLSTAHTASKGTITGLKLRVLSGEYGSNPYANGCAFKVWTAALTQAQLEAEMTTYAVQRTANLFLHYSMKTGLFYAPDNDPLNDQKWLWWEAGGIVSGPAATHLLDAPAPPSGGFLPDVPLGVDLVVQSATHTPVADNVVLVVPSTNLVAQDAVHAHAADNVTTNYVVLAPAAGVHAHTAQAPSLVVDLAVQGATHASVTDNVVLNYVVLAAANALHAHTTSPVVLYPVPTLLVKSCIHTILPVAGPYHEPLLGFISTPDPGPIPDAFILVAKISNLLDVEIAHQADADGSGNFFEGDPFPMTYAAFLRTWWSGWTDPLFVIGDNAQGGNNNQTIADVIYEPGFPIVPYWAMAVTLTPTYEMGMYYSVDGTTWVQITTAPSGYGAMTVWQSDYPVIVGATSTWSYGPPKGSFHSVEMRTGTNPAAGSVMWRMDVTEYVSGTNWVDGRGRTWTLSNPASIVPDTNLNQVHNLAVQSTTHAHLADSVPIAGGSSLAVVDAVHAHTADNVSPLNIDLAVQGALHSSTSVNGAVEVVLVKQDAAHAVTSEAPTLYPVPMLVVAAAVHAVADSAILAVDLYPQGATHASAADGVVLNYVVLAPADAVHAHSAQAPVLVVDPAVQGAAHAVASPDVLLVVDLAVQGAAHVQNPDNVTLQMQGDLAIQSALHNQVTDNVSPLNINMDGVQSALHAPVADTVTNSYNLATQGAAHAHAVDNTIITPAMVVASALHAQAADNVAFTLANNVVVQDAAHAVTDNLTWLPQVHNLAVADAVHALATTDLELFQLHTLAPDAALHVVFSTPISLAGGSTLFVGDSVHSQLAEAPALLQDHRIVAADGVHAHSADNVALYAVPLLVVGGGLHAHTATSVVLYAVPNLTVSDGLHVLSTGNVLLTQQHNLAIDPALHAQTADTVSFFVGFMLLVESALHFQRADGDLDVSNAIVLNNADALYLGTQVVSAVYLGTTKVWP